MAKDRGNRIYLGYKRSIAILVFLALWEVLPRLGLINEVYLPPFSIVIIELYNQLLSGQLLVHLAASLKRSISGLFLAEIIAIPLGILIGWFSKFEEYLDPLLQLFRNLSVLALFPVFVLFLGIGETSKICIILWGTLWATLLNTIEGVKSVDALLIKSAKSMGVSNFELLRKVVLPSALPYIITGFRLSASGSILVLVAAEMLGASSGLGYLIHYSEVSYDIPQMYVGIVSIALLGVISNYLIVHMEKNLTSWKEKVEQ